MQKAQMTPEFLAELKQGLQTMLEQHRQLKAQQGELETHIHAQRGAITLLEQLLEPDDESETLDVAEA